MMKERGLLSQYSPSMPSNLSRSQIRLRWMIALATIAAPFFIWSLWSLEGARSDVPVRPHVTSPVDPGLPFKDSRPRPPVDNFPPRISSSGHTADAVLTASLDVLSSPVAVATPVPGPHNDRPLILYAFFETELALVNYKFYLAHALHDAADFLFIFNGDTDAYKLLPKADNIKYLQRDNTCYDLGAFAEVLLKDDLYLKYKRFITMNASIRGPFLPVWASGGCWSDMYLNLLTDEVKLVGMTMNCQYENHIQSMIWATDRIGLDVLLFPTNSTISELKKILAKRPLPENSLVPPLGIPGINSCPSEYWDAVAIEVYATSLVKAAGYKVSAMMAAYHSTTAEKYEAQCEQNGDVLKGGGGGYYGMDLHPFDTLFAKTNRNIAPVTLKLMTEWMDGRGYSSYDYCR